MIFVIDVTTKVLETIQEKDASVGRKRAALKAFIFGKDSVVADFG